MPEIILWKVGKLEFTVYLSALPFLASDQGISTRTSWYSFATKLAKLAMVVNLMLKAADMSTSSVAFAILYICISMLDCPLQNQTSPNITFDSLTSFSKKDNFQMFFYNKSFTFFFDKNITTAVNCHGG